MRLIFGSGFLLFAMTFCNLGERLQKLQGTSGADSGTSSNSSSTTSSDSTEVERAEMTSAQRSIADEGTEVMWEDQGISWNLPDSWKKMDVRKESFNYGSPATGFLIATISTMPASFPAESSINATYESSLEQLKQGKYETARWLEIDGVKGVEWVEAMPEEKDGPRRHQWIGFRNYQGQNQQLNIIISTKGSNFDDQRDTFAAIMYSMKIPKG